MNLSISNSIDGQIEMRPSSSSGHHGLLNFKRKNINKTVSTTPLRFALLGPHRASKSSIVSILTNEKSLENYYPTVQNSPTLFQFQPKSVKCRALLDVNVTMKDLEELGFLDDESFVLTEEIISIVNEYSRSKQALSPTSSNTNLQLLSQTTTEEILQQTLHYYDLDYLNPDYFSGNSFISPMSSANSGNRLSYFSSVTSAANSSSYYDALDTSRYNYQPPITTPILMELIDTPGVTQEDLIPFLEKSLDSKLAGDVLRNISNNDSDSADLNERSRVKPLIIGSGISDLNGAIDGYLLCYSCVPETSLDFSPPSYSDVVEMENSNTRSTEISLNPSIPPKEHNGFEAIEILKSLHFTLKEAWKEYSKYYDSWESGKEFDVFSLNQTFKNLWKKKDLNAAKSTASSGESMMPPIVIAVTHIDHELASPVLIEKGRKLAREWGHGFVEISCEFENWSNVEEIMGLLIRNSIEDKKYRKKKHHSKKSKK